MLSLKQNDATRKNEFLPLLQDVLVKTRLGRINWQHDKEDAAGFVASQSGKFYLSLSESGGTLSVRGPDGEFIGEIFDAMPPGQTALLLEELYRLVADQ